MNNTEQAASRVLNIKSGVTEADIRVKICALLEVMGIDEYHLEYRVKSGSVDIYLPRLRTIIETKRKGMADNPYDSQAGDRSPFEQVDGYLQSVIKSTYNSLFRDENNLRWTGILTDGQVWHRWTYEHRMNPTAQKEEQNFSPKTGRELATWLSEKFVCDSDYVGKPWIPSNPVSEFRDQMDELREIFTTLPESVANQTETKRKLWGDMLRSSGMYPNTEPARDRLFVSHSFLVALARGVIWSMSDLQNAPNPLDLFGDGFISWIVQTTIGQEWSKGLLTRINGYDWRMRKGDVLRPLYEEFVNKDDRRDFGEVYTPDWLAELLVREMLDDSWCKNSIEAALAEIHNNEPLFGIGVLDPACGSGTFLYHAVLRILNHETLYNLPDGVRTQIAARLVNGIDIHPVACEFSRATLLRALPCVPSGGTANLRVYNGDSLQLQGNREHSLFKANKGEVQIISPGGTGTISLPGSFVSRGDLAVLVEQFTDTARLRTDLPSHIFNSVETIEDRQQLAETHQQLTNIIQREGNSVWAWYITNSVGPYALASHKVNRIVSNPPWVKISKITVRDRHRNLQNAAQQYGLWQGGQVAPHFDIAQLFIKKCREKYLNNPSKDPASWIVKSSAIKTTSWENFRKWRKDDRISAQTVNMVDVQVFGGGDARRSCLLFDIRKSSLGEAKILDGRCLGRPPNPESTLDEAIALIEWCEMPPPIPVGISDYHDRGFRNGATITPKVLTMVDSYIPADNGTVRVTTKASIHTPWVGVGQQTFTVKEQWLLPTINSNDVLVFSLMPGERQKAIVPVDLHGNLLSHDEVIYNNEWARLNDIYVEFRGQGQHTPPTLISQINHLSKLHRQLPLVQFDNNAPLLRVLYPSSGDIMRACRCPEGIAIATGGLFHRTCYSPEEAAYIVGLLNTPVLRKAFKESQTSGRHFQLNPWRKVPIPQFNQYNELHRELASLTIEAEASAVELLDELTKISKHLPGQLGLSNRIRDRLLKNGISNRLDSVVRDLLPDQVR